MKALQTLIYLSKAYGYSSVLSVAKKENLNWRTVNKAHNFLVKNKLIQYDEIHKIWVFEPVGYVHKRQIKTIMEELEKKE